MFEGEQIKNKIYVVCGVSIMKNKNYYPQITALFDNYRDNYSMPKDEFRTMLRYALGWSEEKIERAIQAALDNNVLIDTNLITEELLTPLFRDGSLKKDSYITSTSLAKIYSRCLCEKYVTPHYQGNHIFSITMTGETLFYLLEQKNDLLFQLCCHNLPFRVLHLPQGAVQAYHRDIFPQDIQLQSAFYIFRFPCTAPYREWLQ